jgi:hypothetical protein
MTRELRTHTFIVVIVTGLVVGIASQTDASGGGTWA